MGPVPFLTLPLSYRGMIYCCSMSLCIVPKKPYFANGILVSMRHAFILLGILSAIVYIGAYIAFMQHSQESDIETSLYQNNSSYN